MLNVKLATILDWAANSGVDLDNATIDPRWNSLTFHHRRETPDNIRTLKRVVGGFVVEKGSYDTELKSSVPLNGFLLKISYEGAFECETTRVCKPAKFEDGTDPEVDEI